MYKTYQSLLPMSNLYHGDDDLSSLAITYKLNQSPIILAKVFTGLFPFLVSIVSNYHKLTDDDKASFALEEVHRAMVAYDPNKGAQIQTVISTYLNRRLYAETSMLNHQKRCLNYSAESYGISPADDVDFNSEYFKQKIELSNSLSGIALTHNEMAYCIIVIEESHRLRDAEIARKLNITPAGVSWIKKQLRNKLIPLFT